MCSVIAGIYWHTVDYFLHFYLYIIQDRRSIYQFARVQSSLHTHNTFHVVTYKVTVILATTFASSDCNDSRWSCSLVHIAEYTSLLVYHAQFTIAITIRIISSIVKETKKKHPKLFCFSLPNIVWILFLKHIASFCIRRCRYILYFLSFADNEFVDVNDFPAII